MRSSSSSGGVASDATDSQLSFDCACVCASIGERIDVTTSELRSIVTEFVDDNARNTAALLLAWAIVITNQ